MRWGGRCLYALILSLFVGAVFPLPPKGTRHKYQPRPAADAITRSAPRERASLDLTDRVLLRLEKAEADEPNPHLRDDIRIAWITTLYAARLEPEPFVCATYAVLGIHPEKIWTLTVERRRTQLGLDYDKFFSEGVPKKPVRSVSLAEERKRRAQRQKDSGEDRAA